MAKYAPYGMLIEKYFRTTIQFLIGETGILILYMTLLPVCMIQICVQLSTSGQFPAIRQAE